jgi:hypothetical protein
MQGTNWQAFGIGMAAGVALSVSLYFGWTLIRPAPRETANAAAAANAPMPFDENARVAANAERPENNLRPPPQRRPEPESEPEAEPAPVRVVPPVVRPAPAPEPYDPPPEDDPPPEEVSEKPDE